MVATSTDATFLSIALNRDFSLSLSFDSALVIGLLLLAVLILAARFLWSRSWRSFEIDEVEMGIGSQKISFKPNRKDQEIAYKIWVELSTRKIGLPIDLKNDVVSEVYDSWYNFFSITRELIKDIPVSKLKYDSTRKIIDLSISVLNEGLRPHLTLWQARFRHWYDKRLQNTTNDFDPQAIQAEFPSYKELEADLQVVNKRLMRYREKMKELVLGLPPKNTKKIETKPTLSTN